MSHLHAQHSQQPITRLQTLICVRGRCGAIIMRCAEDPAAERGQGAQPAWMMFVDQYY